MEPFCLLWSRFAGFSPLFRLFFRFWCVIVNPSTVTKRRRNSFGLHLNMSKQCFEVVMRFRFCSTVSKRGTHLADSFFMPNVSCRTFCMRSVEIFTMLAISLIFTRRSANMISWILLTISSVVLNWMTWALFIKNGCSATLKFVVPISYGSHRRCVILIYDMQLFFDFFTRLSVQKQESNHR